MKKALLFLFALLPCMAWAQFDTWFEPASLRVDYTLTGNNNNTTFALKELIREPYWSGSKTNLIDTLEFGNYIVRVYESGTDRLLFSKAVLKANPSCFIMVSFIQIKNIYRDRGERAKFLEIVRNWADVAVDATACPTALNAVNINTEKLGNILCNNDAANHTDCNTTYQP